MTIGGKRGTLPSPLSLYGEGGGGRHSPSFLWKEVSRRGGGWLPQRDEKPCETARPPVSSSQSLFSNQPVSLWKSLRETHDGDPRNFFKSEGHKSHASPMLFTEGQEKRNNQGPWLKNPQEYPSERSHTYGKKNFSSSSRRQQTRLLQSALKTRRKV